MSSEAVARFDCFGGSCAVLVTNAGPAGRAPDAVARARRRLLEWHDQFSRFDPASELSRLNADPGETVDVSPVMARLIAISIEAARQTDGLVDATLVGALETAGYGQPRQDPAAPPRLALDAALAQAPLRRPALGQANRWWETITVDDRAGTVTRPPGLRLDSGGLAKGMFGDILATVLAGHDSFAVDAAGDIRLGGRGCDPRPVQIAGPFDDRVLHTFSLMRGGVATSGIGRRIWRDGTGGPAHHLLDPSTGRPAFTGLVQVSALAPTAVEAEWRAKAALLSGPGAAAAWLPYGGVILGEDGAPVVLAADRALTEPVTRAVGA